MESSIAEINKTILAQAELKDAIGKIQEKYKLSNQEMLDLVEIAYHQYWNEH